MKPLLAVAVTLLLALVASSQTEPHRHYTTPSPPARAALDRLNLTLAWATRLTTDGRRDGLFSVQLFADKAGPKMIVQLYSGAVIALDAETGDLLWRTQVGTPYWPGRPVAVNANAVFTTRRDHLFALDRETGKQVLYDIHADSKHPEWGFRLDGIPSAGLTAEEDLLYVCMGDRVSAYFTPDFRRLLQQQAQTEPAAAVGGSHPKPSPQVVRVWTQVLPNDHFYQPPLATPLAVGLVTTDGTMLSLNKIDGKERGRYQVLKGVVAAPAQHERFAYIGSEDFNLYAFSINSARLVWRYAGASPIHRPVYATDRDVWVSPERGGLTRVDRAIGTARWQNHNAERFLATNPRFVYAADKFGNLLVLDYARGTSLAKYDLRDFTVPIANEWTDRIYLAAHDGTLVCLRHRDYPTPLQIKTPEAAPPIKQKKGKKDDKIGVGWLNGGQSPSASEGAVSTRAPAREPVNTLAGARALTADEPRPWLRERRRLL